jgi:hypothetical protein
MTEIKIYPGSDLPPHLKCQIVSYVRIQWPFAFEADPFADWHAARRDTHPVALTLAKRGVLISHADVNWRFLDHGGETFKVYGLSAVFTYPVFREQGCGHQIVDAASAYIDESDADVAMLFCLPELTAFYAASGWVLMDRATILYGERGNPETDTIGRMMMRFVSEKGRRAKAGFEHHPVYVGEYVW